jgi:hypothetical protein
MEDLFGGKLQGLMQQAQAMQKQMAEAQERAARREVTGEAGGGLVKVTANGVPAIVRVTLDPVTVTDLDMLQDLIVAATNDALKKAKEAVEVELGPLAQMLKASGLGGF